MLWGKSSAKLNIKSKFDEASYTSLELKKLLQFNVVSPRSQIKMIFLLDVDFIADWKGQVKLPIGAYDQLQLNKAKKSYSFLPPAN